jgi:phospholipase/carboxylesterase
MLDTLIKTTGTNPTHSIIWMHGLGADANDFAPIVPELVRPQFPPLKFIFPNAPMRPVTVNGGYVMRAWYDILGADLGQRQDEAGFKASRREIEALIDAEIARGTPSENILLAGFSQGAAMTLYVGLRHAKKLGGLIALSGYLPLAAQTAAEAHVANVGTPIFMAHGLSDPVIAEALAKRSAEALKTLGHPVDYRTYPMPHSVSPQEIDDLANWLGARF